ncbi:hypothetical protein J2J97_32085 (plasmid) [Rhizobium bangladeshense]|uniref:hypothetical protein n=1 Tax=Rhizobium bangladeshense TaxID=1138189 RepID=UPI001A97F663|nr:hypothetical protein [Rhizobium bangladeshense]QSY98546.1 hypothetical protein J2J97_32085 [Rhizobium bangladeshense]
MTVAELIEKLRAMPQDREAIVWMPGTKIELVNVSEQFDHPREKWVVMIEGNVLDGTLSGVEE